MSHSNEFKFEIHNVQDGDEIIVKFSSANEAIHALDELAKVREAYQTHSDRQAIRSICILRDDEIYLPKEEISLPKVRWITVAAAASYPQGIPLTLSQEKTGLSQSAISAYCTSENNPTSEYLYTDGESIHINAEGVGWS
ncbi:MAG: hypothetical protein ACOC3C_08245 [Candidatus Thorarchaeota archaeon]